MRCLISKIKCKHLSVSYVIILLFLLLLSSKSSQQSVIHISDIEGVFGYYNWRDFYIDEPIIFVTKDPTLYVLNSSSLQQLTILGEQESADSVRHFLLKHDDYLFLIRREEPGYDDVYLEIVDVSVPTNPALIGEVIFPSSYDFGSVSPDSFGMLTIEDERYLFIQEKWEDYFLCINCTNVTQPEILDYYHFPGEVGSYYDYFQRFYIRDNIMFFPTSNTTHYGFVAYNFTTVQSMTKVIEWFGETNMTSFDSIYASQDYVYLKEDEAFIEVFTIQNLSTPTRKGYIDLGYCFASLFRGNYLFAVKGNVVYHNITIFDYSNITDLKMTSSYLHPGDNYGEFNVNVFTDSMITESHIYIPIQTTKFEDKMLYILDWSDPYNLFVEATLGFYPETSTTGLPFISSGFLIIVIVRLVAIIKVKCKRK